MRNTKKVALYSPYLDILGGGERHILSILKVFDELGLQSNLLWNDESIIENIARKLSLSFKHVSVIPNFLEHKNPLLTIKNTYEFDFFFYVTDGSYFFSAAKKNYIFAMVPSKDLYTMHGFNRLKTSNFSFISNSNFTKYWLKRWGIHSQVLYPYIDDDYFVKTEEINNKEQIILSVGRFFSHLHGKKHKEIIEMFIKYKQKNPTTDTKLYLVGGLDLKEKNYFDEVKKSASKRNDIVVKANVSEVDLKSLYKRSLYYWHFTGFAVDEEKNPEKVEHLGIAPLEAMAAGCISFCYKAGGPKELIENDKTGFLFSTKEELLKKMNDLENNKVMQSEIAKTASQYVKKHFSYEVFRQNVIDYFKLSI